jgi:hypothetical protein
MSASLHDPEPPRPGDVASLRVGDRVNEGWYSGVIIAQHGPWSWVMVDNLDDPRTHRTRYLRREERP